MSLAARSMHYEDHVRFRAERGINDALTQAARAQRLSASEYARQAIRAKLIQDGVPLPAIERPSHEGQR